MSIEYLTQADETSGGLSATFRSAAGLLFKRSVKLTLVATEKVTGIGTDAEELAADEIDHNVGIGLQAIADGVQREDEGLIAVGQHYIEQAKTQLF